MSTREENKIGKSFCNFTRNETSVANQIVYQNTFGYNLKT